MHNNTKSQHSGRKGWSNRIRTSHSEVGTWKQNTCVCRQVKDASNVIECQLSEKFENHDDGSWQPNNLREIPQLRNMNPKASENCFQKPRQSPKHYKNAARNSSTSENAIFISFGILFPKLRNPFRDESLEFTDIRIGWPSTSQLDWAEISLVWRLQGCPGNDRNPGSQVWIPLWRLCINWDSTHDESSGVMKKWGFLPPIHSSPLVRSSKRRPWGLVCRIPQDQLHYTHLLTFWGIDYLKFTRTLLFWISRCNS